MINFEIYKKGQKIGYTRYIHSFDKENIKTLFIFHGLYGRGKNWQSFAKKMSQDKKTIIITVDLRNHGGNVFNENISYSLMLEDILDLFNYLEIKKTNLLGHSMGGKLAMLLALSNPNYINKIIIVDIAPVNYKNYDNSIIDALLNLNLRIVKNRNHADELLLNHIDQKFLRLFLLQNLQLIDGKYNWSINLTAIKRAMIDLRSFPKMETNNKVDIKSLCIYGGKSDYVNEDQFKFFKNYFTNITFYQIKNAGHFLHIETPDEFYEVSKNFLED